MPQFDTFIYLTFFFTFLIYSFILYFIISLFFVPFFWNIYYFRYLKKENNNLLKLLSLIHLNIFKTKLINYNLQLHIYLKYILPSFKFNKLKFYLLFIFINKLIKFLIKIK